MLKRLLVAPVFASALFAQYTGEPPTTLIPAATFPPLGPAAIGNNVTAVYQCRMVPSFLLPLNTYYVALTVGSTSPAMTYRLMTGTFNEVTGVFTKNTDADGLNTGFTSSELFALTVTNDLLTAAFDTAAGIRWATRPNITSAFTLQPSLVGGITGTYRDPNFGYVNGQDVLFHISGTSIAFGDWGSAGVVSNIRNVALLTGSGAIHSPMPVNDFTGTTRSLTYCDTTPPTSGLTYKLMFASSLLQDSGAPPYKYYDNASWLENGNATGGTITIISGSNSYMDPYRLGIAAISSSTYAANTPGTAILTCFAPQQAPTATPYAGAILLGNLGSAGLALAPIVGKLSLDPLAPLIALPSGTYLNGSGTFQQSVGFGSIPAGAKVWMQSVVLDIPASTIYLSNTGKVEWK